MAKIEINRVTNAGIYVNGDSYIGKAEEINLPMIKPVMSEHKSLGLNSKIELPSGIDKLEGKIKFNSKYPRVQQTFADIFTHIQLQVRYQLESYGSSGRTLKKGVILLTVQSKGVPGGNFKQHDNVELESDFNVLYMKEIIDGEEIFEIDVYSNIYKVKGVDLLSDFKNAIGG
jgi:P2 family phage contractile tail tube protein